MHTYIKPLLIVSIFFFTITAIFAQDSLSPAEIQYIDSLQQAAGSRIENRINALERELDDALEENRQRSDSIVRTLEIHTRKFTDSEADRIGLKKHVERSEHDLQSHMRLFNSEREKLRRYLWIAGGLLFLLILASSTLLVFLIRQQQQDTREKINALKKYTHTEIEETRTSLTKKFRKRIKKLKDNLGTKSPSKKSEKKKKKKK